MEPDLILETTFLIDLEGERQEGAGAAIRFLQANPHCRLHLTHTIAGELASGKSLARRHEWEAFLKPFQILSWTPEVDWEYGKAFQYLQKQGLLIGTNDLWIAATALAYDMPIVSKNIRHFERVPNLRLTPYGPSPSA